MAKKLKKERKPRRSFSEILADQLRAMKVGDVQQGCADDDSDSWVILKIKGTELVFSFDVKGKQMDGVGIYEDVAPELILEDATSNFKEIKDGVRLSIIPSPSSPEQKIDCNNKARPQWKP